MIDLALAPEWPRPPALSPRGRCRHRRRHRSRARADRGRSTRAERLLGGARRPGARRGRRPRRACRRGATPGPLHGVPIAIKEEIDVAGAVTTFGGEANSTPAADDAEWSGGSARRVRSSSARPRCRSSAPSPTPSRSPAASRATRGTAPDARRFQRRYGGRGGGGHGAGRAGRRRRRLDPDPERLLRAVRPQAPARPGDHRAAPAPLVRARHLRAADPQRARQRPRLRRHPRQRRGRPVPRPASRAVRRGGGRDPGPAADRLVDEAGDPRRPPGPGARAGGRGHGAAARPTSATTCARSTRATRTRRPRSCRSSSPASATRPTWSSTTTGSSGVPARPTGSAPGSTPKVIDWALRRPRRSSAKANRVFDDVDVLLTPSIAHRPPKVGHPRRRRHRGVGAARRCRRSRTPPSGTSPATRPPRCPCGTAADGLPIAVQLVGPTDGETTLLSLSAQLEARPALAPARRRRLVEHAHGRDRGRGPRR